MHCLILKKYYFYYLFRQCSPAWERLCACKQGHTSQTSINKQTAGWCICASQTRAHWADYLTVYCICWYIYHEMSLCSVILSLTMEVNSHSQHVVFEIKVLHLPTSNPQQGTRAFNGFGSTHSSTWEHNAPLQSLGLSLQLSSHTPTWPPSPPPVLGSLPCGDTLTLVE